MREDFLRMKSWIIGSSKFLKCFSWPSKVLETYSSLNSIRLGEFQPQKLAAEKATRLRNGQGLESKNPAPRTVTENRAKA